MQINPLNALQIGAALLLIWAIYRDRNAMSLTRAAKAAALEKFRELTTTDGDPRLHFHGSTAKILKLEETGVAWNPGSDGYTLAVWAENAAGEVFHARINSDAVLLKLVPHNVVRAQFPGRKSFS